MKKLLSYLVDYWYVPVFIAALVIGFLLRPRGWNPIDKLKSEFAVIDAGRKVKEAQAEGRAYVELDKIERQHRKVIDTMGRERRAQYDKLIVDPVARARFLVRTATKLGGG